MDSKVTRDELSGLEVRRVILHKTRSSMTFVDFYVNIPDVVLHELYADKDNDDIDPNIRYDYHVVFSLRGEDVQKLKDALNAYK